MPSLLHNGCTLRYELTGHGPPVLLIQGVGVHGTGWAPQTSELSADYTCLTFDNRGIGASLPAGAPITIEHYADDALALMTSQGWDSAHLVGHSMGGLIALALALSAPQRVKSLSLLCTFARGADATKITPRMAWIGIRTRVGTRRSRRRAFLEILARPDQTAVDPNGLAQRLAPVFGHDLADQPPVVMQQLAAMGKCDVTPRLAELAGIPTLVASAEHDLIAPPEYGRRIAAGIPGARFIEMAGAAHGMTVMEPDRVNSLLREHLGGNNSA